MTRASTLVPCCALVLSTLASPPTAARADDSNHRPYVLGARAAGMGGAFTALADDGSGPYYNPGGLAFVERSQLSLSGSVYGVVSGSFHDALGTGRDFNYSNLNTFPTTTAAVWKLGGPGPSERAHVLAVSVFIPDAINIDDRTTIESRENAVFIGNQAQTVWAGLTYARRLGRLGFGASLHGLFGTSIASADFTIVAPGNPSTFATLTRRDDETTYGVVGSLGVRLDWSDQLRFGLSVFSPAFGGGSRKSFTRLGVAGADPATGAPSLVAVANVEDLEASPTLPLRAQAGVAWTSGRLTLSGDVIFLAGRTVHDDANRVEVVLGSPIPVDRRVVRNSVLNGAIGAEYVFDDRFPLRAGFYTDFAASNDPSPTSNVVNTSHMDRFVGTLSIGYKTEHTSTSLGVNLAAATGTDLVPAPTAAGGFDISSLVRSRSTQLLTYVFLGTAYEF